MSKAIAVLIAVSTLLLASMPPVAIAEQATTGVAARQVAAPNDRLYSNTERDLRVTTAVPSADETRKIFGVKLYRQNIQPVWVQIENLGDQRLMLLPMGLDTAYYTAWESAYRSFGIKALDDFLNFNGDEHKFNKKRIPLVIEPRSIQSGYIFSRVDEGTKSFNVDVLGTDEPYTMSFFVPVPGLRLDHYDVDVNALYGEDEIQHVDLPGLAAGLEAMPCCVMDKKSKAYGDPLNIAFVADLDDLWYAFMRAGWDETETVYGASMIKMGFSTLFGSEYRYSPVSALYVYKRPQDAALQRARASIDERNHLRLWLTPLRYQGKPVWIGQISRDIGVRLTTKTITTHKIDPDVDETREFLIEDLAYSQGLSGFAYVNGVGPAAYDTPRANLTGDPYYTDGRRAVMWLSEKPTPISDIKNVDMSAQ